jgi:GTP-binding protein
MNSSKPLPRAFVCIGSDEFVEATPKSLRLRKKVLDENQRKRAAQSRGAKLAAV